MKDRFEEMAIDILTRLDFYKAHFYPKEDIEELAQALRKVDGEGYERAIEDAAKVVEALDNNGFICYPQYIRSLKGRERK